MMVTEDQIDAEARKLVGRLTALVSAIPETRSIPPQPRRKPVSASLRPRSCPFCDSVLTVERLAEVLRRFHKITNQKEGS